MSFVAQSAARGAQRLFSLTLLTLLFARPVMAQPKAGCTPVAARALARGQVLAAEDIAMRPDGGDAARCTLSSTLVGAQVRRVMVAGELLRAPAVAPPDVIRQNEAVRVVWRDAGIEVRVAGVAANAAPAGGRVTVRVDARRRLDGVAVAPGLVEIR